jgi:hypothetical protein
LLLNPLNGYEISNIFLNPFLAYSVSENWGYIEKLIDIGVDLKDANITRLKWELAEVFEKDLLSDKEEHENQNIFEEGDKGEALVDEFMKIAHEISCELNPPPLVEDPERFYRSGAK